MRNGSWAKRYMPIALLMLALVLAGCFAPTTGTGTIVVTSEPEGAKVFLDGDDTGRVTPATIEGVQTGTHTVTVEYNGDSQTRSVRVARSQTTTVHFNFTAEDPDEPEPPVDPDAAVVTGRIKIHRGSGSPLAGATVTAYVTGTDEKVAATTSDDEGFYILYLSEGTYDIVVDFPGHGQAKRQALSVEAKGRETSVDLLARQIFMPGREAVAPTLTVMLQDDTASPTIPFEPGTIIDDLTFATVFVDAAHPVDRIDVWVGSRHHQSDFRGAGVDELEIFLWDFFDAPGDNYLRVAAYDVQGNWTEIVIPFVYAVGPPGTPPAEVEGVDLIAFTYGADLGLYRQQRQAMFDRLGLPGDPNLFDIGDGTIIDLTSIRDDVTMYTVVRWDEVPGAWGYLIERGPSAIGPWEQIAKVGDLFPQPYMDFGAALQPGKRMYYRVTAVGPNGELGRPSQPVWVEHLPRYEVRLVSPADDAVDVPLVPTFRWTHNDVGADVYRFSGFVAAVTSEPGGGLADYYTWYFENVENITEIEYGDGGEYFADLKPAKSYVWNIDETRAIKFYRPNSAAVALSGPDVGAVNGEFTFTTVSER